MAERATPPRTLQLPEILDLPAAAPLTEAFLARRGADLVVDAGQVRQVGASCVQVLLSAAATWRADGAALRLVAPSPELLNALRLLGIVPGELPLTGDDQR